MSRHDPKPPSDASTEFERLLTTDETAEILGITGRTVRTLVRAGSLPAVRFGGSVRIDPADLRRFVNDAKAGQKGAAQ
jgi:excisionase family DNA binding protein